MTSKLKVVKATQTKTRRSKQAWMENDHTPSAYETLEQVFYNVTSENNEVIASYQHKEDAVELVSRLSMSEKKIKILEAALKKKALELCRKLIKAQAEEVKEWKKKAQLRRQLASSGAPVPEELFDLAPVFKTEEIFVKIDELK